MGGDSDDETKTKSWLALKAITSRKAEFHAARPPQYSWGDSNISH